MIDYEKTWQDVCNVFQDAVDHDLAEITLLEEETQAYAGVMGGMMSIYAQYMLNGMVVAPKWLADEYDNYRAIFVRIAEAANNEVSVTLNLDEVAVLNKVLDEFISKLLPIAIFTSPLSMLPLLLDNPDLLGDI